MKRVNTILFACIAFILTSCGNASLTGDGGVNVSEPFEDGALSEVEREALTPDMVLEELQEGNQRFQIGETIERNNQKRIRETVSGQYPKAVVLSCIDSRVPVEEVFDQGIGDLFVGRVAGNIADEEMLGSLEYSTKVAGSEVVVVMGHQNCGAVKSAIANVELGNITPLLAHIDPALEMTDHFPATERNAKNKEYLKQVIINNVYNTLDEIREESPIIAELEEQDKVKLVGAYYSLEDGSIKFLEEK